MRIMLNPQKRGFSAHVIESSCIPLDSIPPNTLTPLKELKGLWQKRLTVKRPSERSANASALSTTLQSTLVPDSRTSPDFSDVNIALSNLERESRELNAIDEVMPLQKTGENCPKHWNQDAFKGVFYNHKKEGVPISKLLNFKPLTSSTIAVHAPGGWPERETTSGFKQTQHLKDSLPAVDYVRSPSLFNDNDIASVGNETYQQEATSTPEESIAETAEASSPKRAVQRGFGEDAEEKAEERRTGLDPLDDPRELDRTKICTLRNARAPKHFLKKDNITLRQWVVKGMQDRGVFVEGKRVDCEDLYWHSNIIINRIDPYMLNTRFGRVYELQGPPDTGCMLRAGCPPWLVKKFELGFPENWKDYVASFLTLNSAVEPCQANDPPRKDNVTKSADKKTTSSSNSNTESDHRSVGEKVKQKVRRKVLSKELKLLKILDPEDTRRRPKSKNRAAAGSQSALTSRSGRQIKPVLKYWCGERISVDCRLNANVIRAGKDALTDSIEKFHNKRANKNVSYSRRSKGKRPVQKLSSSSSSSSSKAKTQSGKAPQVKKTNSKNPKSSKSKEQADQKYLLNRLRIKRPPLDTRYEVKMHGLQPQVRCHRLSNATLSSKKNDARYKGSKQRISNEADSSLSQNTGDSEANTLTEDNSDDVFLSPSKSKRNMSSKASKSFTQPSNPSRLENGKKASKNRLSKDHGKEMQEKASDSPVSDSSLSLPVGTEESPIGRRLRTRKKLNPSSSGTSGTHRTSGNKQPMTDEKSSDSEDVVLYTRRQPVRKKKGAAPQKSKQKTARLERSQNKNRSSSRSPSPQSYLTESRPGSRKKISSYKFTQERNSVKELLDEQAEEESSSLNSTREKRLLSPKLDKKRQPSCPAQELSDMDEESLQDSEAWSNPRNKAHVSRAGRSKNRLSSTPKPRKGPHTRSQRSGRGFLELEATEKPSKKTNGDPYGETSETEEDFLDRETEGNTSGTEEEDCDASDDENYGLKHGAKKRAESTKPSRGGHEAKEHRQRVNSLPRLAAQSRSEVQPPQKPSVEVDHQEQWTNKEIDKLFSAVSTLPKYKRGFWLEVAMAVGNHSAEECMQKYFEKKQAKETKKRKASSSQAKKKASSKEKKESESKEKEEVKITAKVGTLKRKQQMWDFLDNMKRDEEYDDIFTSSPFRNKLVKLPAMSTSSMDDAVLNLKASTPKTISLGLSDDGTPQCSYISPGMMRPIDRAEADKYVYRLQKSMKKSQFTVNLNKRPGGTPQRTPTSRRVTPLRKDALETSSVIAKLFKKPEVSSSDEEEKDYYFSSSEEET